MCRGAVHNLGQFLKWHRGASPLPFLVYIKRVKQLTHMATRSRIGIELNDGSILSAYHHWDGSPSWLGRILNTQYHTKAQVASLIDGGDMSCAWTKDRWTKDGGRQETDTYGPEYYSDRGEDTPPTLSKDMDDFFSIGEEYSYIFRNGNWFAYDMHQFEDQVAPEPVEIPEGALAC